ncbi:Protein DETOXIFICATION 42 [Camellia lanceoleosa]|uniref:Protein DETOXIFICATION 42 n=1 Tax=Camellia lanceoleosa TaxID=1840588 RepID=A0ACC0GM05_9ERIC|nr:Protein DETOXIFICATION 42 [Camellia lanceoleosa]
MSTFTTNSVLGDRTWKRDCDYNRQLRLSVGEVKPNLNQIGHDIEIINQMVFGLIELLESKQDTTNSGLWYLCQLAGGMKDGLNTKPFQLQETLNVILDPILIFVCHLGVSGAAITHVISEYLISPILLCKLMTKVDLFSYLQVSKICSLIDFLKTVRSLIHPLSEVLCC